MVTRQADTDEQTTRVQLTKNSWTRFAVHGVQGLPGDLHTVKPFNFDPLPFSLKPPVFRDTLISSSSQQASLTQFMDDPQSNCIYSVTGSFSDLEARYFAAFLVDQYLARTTNTHVEWVHLKNKADVAAMITAVPPCSLLVITGAYPTMMPSRVEAARDLLDAYADIPRIIVGSGEDPITFCVSRLNIRPTRCYFIQSTISGSTDVV